MLFVDNRYVAGSNTPISRTDADGNTYQHRRLADATEHDVLKNFPTAGEVRSRLSAAGASTVEVAELKYYWYATYEIASHA